MYMCVCVCVYDPGIIDISKLMMFQLEDWAALLDHGSSGMLPA